MALLLLFVHPVYATLVFVLQPVIFIGVFLAQLAYFPIELVKRFETVYIYLGVGSLVGITTGLVTHLLLSFLVSSLGLKATRPAKGRTAKEHRQQRQQRQGPFSSAIPQAEPTIETPDTIAEPDKPVKQDRRKLFALPRLTLQGPSPEGKRSLLAQTMEDDPDSDIL